MNMKIDFPLVKVSLGKTKTHSDPVSGNPFVWVLTCIERKIRPVRKVHDCNISCMNICDWMNLGYSKKVFKWSVSQEKVPFKWKQFTI